MAHPNKFSMNESCITVLPAMPPYLYQHSAGQQLSTVHSLSDPLSHIFSSQLRMVRASSPSSSRAMVRPTGKKCSETRRNFVRKILPTKRIAEHLDPEFGWFVASANAKTFKGDVKEDITYKG